MKMEWDYAGAVVISGLVIVFVALILLIIAVWVMGKVFTKVIPAIQSSRQKKGADETVPAPSVPIVPQPPVTRTLPEEDDNEVIAVIAAAIAAISAETGTGLKIKSIRPKRQGRTSAWASAAARESVM
ncbi:MAG: OadG family protein [Oscillospiraceae bacterium]|nr:OadG family protein [Oscillospiraceae bacterium]